MFPSTITSSCPWPPILILGVTPKLFASSFLEAPGLLTCIASKKAALDFNIHCRRLALSILCDIEYGVASGPVPHCRFGWSLITNRSSPPRITSSWVMKFRSRCTPSSRTSRTYTKFRRLIFSHNHKGTTVAEINFGPPHHRAAKHVLVTAGRHRIEAERTETRTRPTSGRSRRCHRARPALGGTSDP